MFCQKCGANNNDGSKFCEKCGAPLEAAAAPNPNPGYGPAPGYVPYVAKKPKTATISNSVAGIMSDIKTADKKLMTKAIAVVLMLVTALSMMIGLVKEKSTVGEIDKDSAWADFYNTENIFQVAKSSAANSTDVSDAVDSAKDPSKKEESRAFNFSAATVFFTISAIVIGLAAIAFALAFFLMAIKSKNAAFVAQVACLLAAAGIILAFVGMFFYSEGQKKGGTASKYRMTFTWGSIVALAAAVGSFFYIGMNKKDIVE